MPRNPEGDRQAPVPAVTLPAIAKVNLHLGVHAEKDARGYHRVDSVMVGLALADLVTVRPASELHVSCVPAASFPEEKNTAYKAAALLAKAFRRDGTDGAVDVTLEKRIPEQGGLGGSSTDAASVLLALCELWGIDPADERVGAVARSVGADVPFFLDPRPTLLVGAGDVPKEVFPPLDGVPMVLVRPQGAGVSTAEAYREFDRMHDEPADPEPMCEALRAGDARAVAGLLANNLDPVATRLLPEVGRVKEWLSARPGVLGCQVTGSGSCVFAICDTDESAREVAAAARNVSSRSDGNGSWWSMATVTISSPRQISADGMSKLC